jgi:3-dehydroquinate synthetase
VLSRSVEIKAEVVSEDERESGRRAILNAGHTVAHALERATDYAIPHGEAVGLGLVAECALAARLGLAETAVGERVAALLQRLGLPGRLTVPLSLDRVIAAMASDKKNRASRIRFAFPRAVGVMERGDRWTSAAPEAATRIALASIL